MKTAARIDAPTALLVALDDHLGALAFSYFDDAGMRIVAVRDVASACARVAEVMPQVIVTRALLPADEIASLREHASAAGSEVVELVLGCDSPAVRANISAAIKRRADRKRLPAR